MHTKISRHTNHSQHHLHLHVELHNITNERASSSRPHALWAALEAARRAAAAAAPRATHMMRSKNS
eukprot:10187328-Karenia_brevis.AAC.1